MIIHILFLPSSGAAAAFSVSVATHAGIILLVVGVVIVIVAAVVVTVVLLRWRRSTASFFKLHLPVCTVNITVVEYYSCITLTSF